MDFKKLAESGAKKVCTADCHLHFECGHPDKEPWPGSKPLFGLEKCPLEKYHVQHEKDKKPWWEIPRSEAEPSQNELFALCAQCSNSVVKKTDDGYELEPKIFNMCMDCPVEHVRECLDEGAAEAACS